MNQVRLVELLEDKTFRKHLRTIPRLPPIATSGGRLPWRVYVQREAGGKWAKKDFADYRSAYELAAKLMRQHVNDLAIHSRSVSFAPPGRWVKLTKNGKPLWQLDPQTKKPRIDPTTGKRVQRQRFVVMGMPVGHQWCPYCRRPTVFTWFLKHHAFTGLLSETFSRSVERCTICGITDRGARSDGR